MAYIVKAHNLPYFLSDHPFDCIGFCWWFSLTWLQSGIYLVWSGPCFSFQSDSTTEYLQSSDVTSLRPPWVPFLFHTSWNVNLTTKQDWLPVVMGNWWLGIFSGSVVVSISKSFFCRFVEYLQTTIITFPHPQVPRQADCKSLDRNLSSHRPPWQHHHHYQSSVCSDIYFLPTVFSSQGSFFSYASKWVSK